MKLIELLARDLKEWPSDEVVSITQSCVDKELYGLDADDMVVNRGTFLTEFADDTRSYITRQEWETATYSPTPTLETMLFEWRDLEARAQAAQAEADALFEHAGQCHGEIVVRLAELGWGAPRAPMVPGEPVVTLDDSDGWIEYHGSEILANDDDVVFVRLRSGSEFCGAVNTWDWSITPGDPSDGDIIAYRFNPSTQP